MKLAVIYDSKTNNTAAVAGYMADGMNSIEGVEAKTFMYSEADTEFIKECTGVVFGCPTTWQVLLLIFTPGWKNQQKL